MIFLCRKQKLLDIKKQPQHSMTTFPVHTFNKGKYKGFDLLELLVPIWYNQPIFSEVVAFTFHLPPFLSIYFLLFPSSPDVLVQGCFRMIHKTI